MKYIAACIGLLLMLLGAITLFTPMPIGVILFASGLSILVCVSQRAQALLRNLRGKSQRINKALIVIEAKIETKLVRLHIELMKTRPPTENTKDAIR